MSHRDNRRSSPRFSVQLYVASQCWPNPDLDILVDAISANELSPPPVIGNEWGLFVLGFRGHAMPWSIGVARYSSILGGSVEMRTCGSRLQIHTLFCSVLDETQFVLWSVEAALISFAFAHALCERYAEEAGVVRGSSSPGSLFRPQMAGKPVDGPCMIQPGISTARHAFGDGQRY